MMNINKSYIHQCFKQEGIQLSPDALEDIIRHFRVEVGKMALRCKEGNIKRLTPELLYVALGQLSKWKGGK